MEKMSRILLHLAQKSFLLFGRGGENKQNRQTNKQVSLEL